MSGARDEALIKAFGEVLRGERQSAGLTQEQLAGRAELDRTFIGMLESGKRQPSLSAICAIAHGVGITPSALVDSTVKRALMSKA